MPTLIPALLWAACCALLLGGGGAAHAQSRMYTCVDAKGNTIVRDRPIVECLDREQRVLNRDGSVQRVVPPTPQFSWPLINARTGCELWVKHDNHTAPRCANGGRTRCFARF